MVAGDRWDDTGARAGADAPWVAIGFGALDLRGSAFGGEYELVVTPVEPGPPLFLYGAGAALWRRLATSETIESLSRDERRIATEMEEMGIAARDSAHTARISQLKAPWLTSPMHEMVYALLGNVAAQEDVEIVFIKGPVLHAQGLRERAHSGDVDCWVPTADVVRFARAMQRWGWRPAFSAFTATQVLHSLTLRAGEWGSAVDVHDWFPGIVLQPDEAFKLVRAETETREYAGHLAQTPSAPLHAVIAALHEVRPLQGRDAGSEKITSAADMLRKGGPATVAIVRRARAEYALGSALTEAFPDEVFSLDTAVAPGDWAWRLESSLSRSYAKAFALIPLRQRARVLFRVLWPSAESLRAGPMADDTASVTTIRLRRVLRGLGMAFRSRRGEQS